MMKKILILGAGFGGLELASRLSKSVSDQAQVTLIDKNDGFVFGFSKFEFMFGRATPPEVTLYYRDLTKPGVEFRQEMVVSIDPAQRRVETDKGSYEADILVVALGADYDIDSTPGLSEGGHEFYTVEGAAALRDVLRSFKAGVIVVGVIGQPFKCPPAPCEAAMLLDEYFLERGVRSDIEISVVSQWAVPIPPSPDASKAIFDRFNERGISWVSETVITSLDPDRKLAMTQAGGTIPYDLFLAVPVHRVPEVVEESGLSEDGWIPVDKRNLSTKFDNVFAIGDVTSAPVPKAGVFAESAARAVADQLVAQIRRGGSPAPFDGSGPCYIEFGDDQVGRVDVDFLSGPTPTAPYAQPSVEVAAEKREFASVRYHRWFRPA